MSAQQPGSSAHPSAGDPTRTIVCTICQAVYSPSRWHEHLLLAPSALESAFMGMCHFCFRCRRPSCPECWDDVHGVCAQCGRESQLPFRQVTAPLSPLLFTIPRRAQLERAVPASVPLLCIAPGKFHTSRQLPIEEIVTNPPVQPKEHRTVRKPVKQQNSTKKKTSQMQVTSQTQGRQDVEQTSQIEIDEIKTVPERRRSATRRFERIVTIVLSVVFVIVIMLIAAASISGDANTFIASTLHVDIRTEIAYLWQLITHLFS